MIHPDVVFNVVRAGRLANLVKLTKNAALAR
jgi:hypothetical protein